MPSWQCVQRKNCKELHLSLTHVDSALKISECTKHCFREGRVAGLLSYDRTSDASLEGSGMFFSGSTRVMTAYRLRHSASVSMQAS
jgi:hypothetical protein